MAKVTRISAKKTKALDIGSFNQGVAFGMIVAAIASAVGIMLGRLIPW